MRIRLSLKNKLVLAIAAAIIFFGGIATYFVFTYSRQIILVKAQESLELLASQQTVVVGEIFRQTQAMVKTMAGQAPIISYLEGDKALQDERVLRYLEMYNIGGYVSAAYLMDAGGTTIVSTDKAFTGNNYAFREYFKSAMAGRSGFAIQVGVTSKQLGYYFSYPIKSADGKIIGAAVIKLSPDFIDSSIELSPLRLKGISTMLVNGQGIVIYANKQDRLYKSLGKLSNRELAKIVENKDFPGIEIRPLAYTAIQQDIDQIGRSKVYEFFDIADNEDEVIIMTRIMDYPAFIFIETSAKEFTDQAGQVALLLLSFILLAMALCILMIIMAMTIVFRPLKKLVRFAETVGTGNIAHKVSIRTGDELEDLALSLNKMSDRLFRSQQNIEKKVAERTEQLQKINKMMTGRELKMMELKKELEELKNKK